MNIIITGATSFIGKAVAAMLHEEGHRVFPIRHSLNELSGKELAELYDRLHMSNDQRDEAVDKSCPEHSEMKTALIHFAWAGVGSAGRSDAKIQQYNVEMSEETLRIATELLVDRFIFAGSQAEYGRPDEGVYMQTESNVCHPVSEYGKAKLRFGLLGAEFCREYNQTHDRKLKFIHTRIFSVYGEDDHETSLVNTCIKNFTNGNDMDFGAATQDWNYMHIEDAVRAIMLLCCCSFETADPIIMNIAGSEIHPLRWYIERIAELCNSDSKKNFGVLPDRAEGNTSLRPEVSRLKALGFKENVSFDEGINRLIEGALA